MSEKSKGVSIEPVGRDLSVGTTAVVRGAQLCRAPALQTRLGATDFSGSAICEVTDRAVNLTVFLGSDGLCGLGGPARERCGADRLYYWIDAHARSHLAREVFGKRTLLTDRRDWSNEQILLAYRGQSEVERCVSPTQR